MVLFLACLLSATSAATGKWMLFRNVNQTKVKCMKLNVKHHSPKYDAYYDTAEQCQHACLNEVPQCNTVNYSPSTFKHIEKGKCGFEHCVTLNKFDQKRHFNSYVYMGPDGAPTLPGNWIKVRTAAQEKVKCEHLNNKRGQKPHYDSDYDSVEECQTRCLNDVPRCNTVNYSPKETPQVVKAGKCQFEFCTPEYLIGGTKHYDSYMYNGMKGKSTTVKTTSSTTTTTTAPWTLWRNGEEELGCEPLNTGDATPSYNHIYSNLAQCQAACQNDVPTCNAINYADERDPRVQGKCQFQYCDPSTEPRSKRSLIFKAFRFNGKPDMITRPQLTRGAVTGYDRDGWALVDTPRQLDLGCRKINDGPIYDPRTNGPKYGTAYPGDIYGCKLACQNQVAGCDAINYNRGQRGVCQFQQCNGVVVVGNARGFESYFFKRPTTATRPPNRNTPATRPPANTNRVETRPPLNTNRVDTRPPANANPRTPSQTSGASTVAVSDTGLGKHAMPAGTVVAIVVSIVVGVAALAVGGVFLYLKVIKKSSASEGLM